MINYDWSHVLLLKMFLQHFAKTQAWATWSFSWFTMVTVRHMECTGTNQDTTGGFVLKIRTGSMINNDLILLSIIKLHN